MRTMHITPQGQGHQVSVDQLVDHLVAVPTAAPRGRKGLWGALAVAVTPRIAERALPLTDTAAFGVTVDMFDYDPDRAASLWSD